MDLLASTFYRKNSASQAATQTRLAQAEANKAADALQRLIDQPPPPERAAPVIDQTINRLTVLHRRIDQHSALLADVLEAEEKLKEQRGLQQARVDELAALLADALAAAAALETKRLSISEELVLVKSQLSVSFSYYH